MPRILRAGIVLPAVAAVAVFLGLALVHVRDNYHVDHVAGAWMGLVAYADDGVLYPPLHDNGYFGGTRYGPLGIALNTAAAKVTGEYLVSGKVVALLTMGVLLTVVYVVARRLGCERTLSVAAVGAVIATFTALFAGTTIYGDALAVTLQVSAVAIIARRVDRHGAIAAGILAALAIAAKPSAVWGAATVMVWLMMRERRQVPAFLAVTGATAVAVFGIAALVSDGRIDDNLVGLGTSGSLGWERLIDAPEKAWDLLVHNAGATAILLPIAAVGIVVTAGRRRVEIVDLAFVIAGLLTLVVLADVGTGFNHLLDMAVLAPLVVASTQARVARPALQGVLVGALVVGTLVSLADARHDVREAAVAIAELETPDRLRPSAVLDGLAEPYFTEDASLAVERGERPVALDSFMLLRILRDDRALERHLIARFDRREFTAVVLFMDLDLDDPWWSDSHLGLDVARAIDRNYRFVRRIQGPVFAYRLLEPRDGPMP